MKTKKPPQKKKRLSVYPRPGSNRHAFKGQGILSPSCLPIPPLRHLHKKSRFYSGPCGAENETRTRDPDLGKVVLYQLSYFRKKWSGKRDSNSRPRPWQGRALPTELFPLRFTNRYSISRIPLANCAAKVQLFSILQTILRKFFFLCSFSVGFASNRQTIPTKLRGDP